MKHFIVVFSALLGSFSAFATNVVFNAGETNYFIQGEVQTNWTDVIVGSNTFENILTVQASSQVGSFVSNANLVVGADLGASNNVVRVNTADWIVSEDISVGAGGAGNRLELLNESIMVGRNANIGETIAASNSMVMIGQSVLLLSSNLTVGTASSGNQLEIVNDGEVYALTAQVGASGTVSNNLIAVSGTNSLLNISETLMVGAVGNAGNMVTVTNFGVVIASNLTISAGNAFNLDKDGTLAVGVLDAGQSGFNWTNGSTLIVTESLTNLNLVSGNDKQLQLFGASWTNAGLVVGGVSNTLDITQGTQVGSDSVNIGGTGSEELNVKVSGPETEWRVDGNLGIEGGTSNRVDLFDGAVVESKTGSVGGSGSENAVAVISDFGTEWNIENELNIGTDATNTFLGVSGGGRILSGTGMVGGGSSLSNTVLVTGDFSQWSITNGNLSVQGEVNQVVAQSGGWIVVGDAPTTAGSGGLLVARSNGTATVTISDDATVFAYPGTYIGSGEVSTGKVTIADGGTLNTALLEIEEGSTLELNNAGTLQMVNGFDAGIDGFNWNAGGHLQVENGSLLGMASTNIGEEAIILLDGDGRRLSIAEGATWDTGADSLAIGLEGDGSSLIVTNGGEVETANAYIGFWSDNNGMLISGTNSLFNAREALLLGSSNTVGNSITITNSGRLTTRDLFITNGVLTLEQDGILDIAGDFIVEGFGTNFQWNSGALELSGTLDWNGNLDQTNQTLTLKGPDAAWKDREAANLVVGADGFGNTLQILNGATVSNINAFVGQNAIAVSNSVEVSGSGSGWVNTGTLTIGHASNSNNAVTVTANGRIVADSLTIKGENDFNLEDNGTLDMTGTFDAATSGFNWNSGGTLVVRSNLVNLGQTDGTNRNLIVDGGRVVSTNEVLRWGNIGRGNSMSLVNTGKIESASAYIGDATGADHNTVSLDGSSIWMNTGDLFLGNLGSNNELMINSSSAVYSVQAFVGVQDDASGNTVWVSGTNSSLSVDDNLIVGVNGSGNTMNVTNGATVTSKNGQVGLFGDNNTATINTGGRWLNDQLYVGWEKTVITTNDITLPDGSTIPGDIETNRVAGTGNAINVEDGGRVETKALSIIEGNSFNLNNGGTLHVDDSSGFNITNEQYAGLNWNSGGNLSLTGELLGHSTTNLAVGFGVTNTFGFLDEGKILTLDGIDAKWNNDNLILGFGSGETKLVLTNGGTSSQADTFIGWQNSSDNAVVVASNSVMKNTGNLYLGLYQDEEGKLKAGGIGSSLTVSNGGWVLVGDVTTNSFNSTDSGIVVADSLGSELLVKNGSQVLSEAGLWVGLAGKTGTVTVANNSSIETTTLDIESGSVLNLDAGGRLKVNGTYNYVAQSNVVWNEGAELAIGGELINLEGLFQTNRILSIEGANARWDLGSTNLVVGEYGSDNQLLISEGGMVSNNHAFVGRFGGANRNSVLVSDSNTLWSMAGTLNIGNGAGIENSVSVSDNATIQVSGLNIADRNSFNLNANGNLRITTNFNRSAAEVENLNWNAGGQLIVEGDLTGMPETDLAIGTDTNAYAFLSGERLLTLDGGTWSVGPTNLIIGFESSSDILTVTNGGTVANAEGYIGWGSSKSKNNSVLVSGTGAAWQNNGNLYIDAYWNTESNLVNAGGNNTLTVSDGGWVFVGESGNTNLTGGIQVASTNGVEMVVGGGGKVDVGSFYVGGTGSATGVVDVRKGGEVTLNELVIEANTNNAFNLAGTLNVVSNNSFNAGMSNFEWQDNGSLVMQESHLTGISSITGSNRTVKIEGGSWSNSGLLAINGYNSQLSVESSTNNQSVVTSLLGASIGEGTGDSKNSVTLSGSNTVWNNTGDLYVGENGYENSLEINNGAINTVSGMAFIGFAASASNNTVVVNGSNSFFGVGTDLYVGRFGGGNSLSVGDQAGVDIGGSLFIQSNSTLNVDASSSFNVATNMTIADSEIIGNGTILFGTNTVNTLKISGTNSFIDSGIVFDAGNGNDRVEVSDWTFTVSSNTANQYLDFKTLQISNDGVLTGTGVLDAFGGIILDGATIAPDNGTLSLVGELTVTNNPSTLDVTLGRNRTDLLKINNGGTFALSNLNAKVTVLNDILDPSDFSRVIMSGSTNLTGVFNDYEIIEEYPLFIFEPDYTNDVNEVSIRARVQPDGELSTSLRYAGSEGMRAGFGGMKNAVFTRTKQLRRNLVATAHSIPQEAFLLSNTNAPVGAQGPGDQNTIFDMHVWMDVYSGQGDYDRVGNSSAFTLNNVGTTIGADRLFGDSLTAGFNYTYARSDASTENHDKVDTETYWLGAYGEWVSREGLYVDAMAAYGWSDYDSRRVINGYTGSASYDGHNIGSYLDVGQYYHYKDLVLSPYVGLHFLTSRADKYTEKSQSGIIEMQVDSTDRTWLESAIGLKCRYRFDTRYGRYQLTGYGEWMHDFIQDDIDTSLAVEGFTVNTAEISPDTDMVNAGAGLSWICTDYMEVGIGYNGRFSDNYEEHNGSIIVDVMF
jgi:T5SS/PEP-CTERM-associated repeat protein